MQGNPTITAAEIARLAGVGRAAVSNWRKRHTDFPAPVGGTAASPEFDLAQVEQWLREQGKLPELSPADRLWRQLTADGGNPAARLADVGAYLLARQRGEQPAEGAPTGLDQLADEHGVQVAFDELWQRFAAPAPGRPRPTPDDLADLMAALGAAGGGTVLDPACGSGGLLRAAVRAGCTGAYGQEIDEPLARLAGAWLALREVVPGEVHTGDSLRTDAFPGRTVDTVLCHPPFGAINWGQEELSHDPRWEFGPVPRTEPELAWTQHALAHLRSGGLAVLLMPPAVASRRAGRRIRAELLRRGALRAVIALPAGVAAPHGVPLHLWVLRRPTPDAPPPARALLVDAADGDLDRVLATWRAFTAAPDTPVDEPGYARAVPIIELLDEEVDLTPARRQPATGLRESAKHLVSTRDRLAALVTELPRLIPQVATGPDETAAPQTVSITDLIRSGAVQLLGPIRATAEDDSTGPDDGPVVLTVHDVLNGTDASGRDTGRLGQQIPVSVGDVLVPMIARQLTARVVTTGGPLLGRNLYLLRPNPAALDPWFLAGQLRTSTNEKQASSLSGTLRFDIRRAQVRRLPLDEQRGYGTAFRQLDTFESAIRQVTELGAELVRLTADGLARGALTPDELGR
ncbi:N-6 DNA methylase [Micromonospora sp. CPCC 206060]|uniref:N-6 DNA methylase n=1 Tax=Micromonospora sp. CPCC 206060 TaxID=3122406 RepID=UPI002FF10CC7